MKHRKPLAIFNREHDRSNAFMSFRRGWTDGAKAAPENPKDTSTWYLYGYQEGYAARKNMNKMASKLTGHTPSPLRSV